MHRKLFLAYLKFYMMYKLFLAIAFVLCLKGVYDWINVGCPNLVHVLIIAIAMLIQAVIDRIYHYDKQ